MIPDDLPESLTLEQLRHIWGEIEREDYAALVDSQFDEDDRVNAERKVK